MLAVVGTSGLVLVTITVDATNEGDGLVGERKLQSRRRLTWSPARARRRWNKWFSDGDDHC